MMSRCFDIRIIYNKQHFSSLLASYEDEKPLCNFQEDHIVWDRHYTLKVSLKYKLSDLVKKFPVLGKTGSEKTTSSPHFSSGIVERT